MKVTAVHCEIPDGARECWRPPAAAWIVPCALEPCPHSECSGILIVVGCTHHFDDARASAKARGVVLYTFPLEHTLAHFARQIGAR